MLSSFLTTSPISWHRTQNPRLRFSNFLSLLVEVSFQEVTTKAIDLDSLYNSDTSRLECSRTRRNLFIFVEGIPSVEANVRNIKKVWMVSKVRREKVVSVVSQTENSLTTICEEDSIRIDQIQNPFSKHRWWMIVNILDSRISRPERIWILGIRYNYS